MRSKVLVLGGTSFIGRHFVEQMLKNAHVDLVLANRGSTNQHLFSGIRRIVLNRMGELPREIADESWDYVIDFSCYFPDSLQAVIDGLNHQPKKYIFISTCSVYDNEDYKLTLRNETAPILTCTEQQKTDESPASYGARKAECERILIQSGLPYTILRPALVVGPYDSTDRFYYWLYQLKHNTQLLFPNEGKNVFSITYVKDLVNTIIAVTKPGMACNIFNVISHPQTSITEIVSEARNFISSESTTVNIDPTYLLEKNVAQWTDIPLWLNCNYFTYSNKKIIDKLGITSTPLSTILVETIEYFESIQWPKPTYGMSQKETDQLITSFEKETIR